jgi:hypothetical protein
VLHIGSSANQKVTILNILEYIGAWEWYDRQVELSQTTIRTKKNKPVKWISGIGRVALGKGEDESDLPLESCDVGITERERQLRRKRISIQLSRGQKLSTKLVKNLGLGILFSSKIW